MKIRKGQVNMARNQSNKSPRGDRNNGQQDRDRSSNRGDRRGPRDTKGQGSQRENRRDERPRNQQIRHENERDDGQQNMPDDLVFGRNAVMEALGFGEGLDKVLVQDGSHGEGSIHKIIQMAKDLDLPIKTVSKEKLDQLTLHGKHQGVALFKAAWDYKELEDIFALAEEKGEAPFIILLDQIVDPHNLGAILRTANITGAHGVVITKNRAVSLTATVAKTSAGAIEHTPVCRVTNMARTIEELQAKGVWITGADMGGQSMYDIDFKGAIGLVIGNEGSGISRLVREKCDFIASIPMKGDINSLNASVAAGVLMYEAFRQKHYK